jgi:hypothetical protein
VSCQKRNWCEKRDITHEAVFRGKKRHPDNVWMKNIPKDTEVSFGMGKHNK